MKGSSVKSHGTMAVTNARKSPGPMGAGELQGRGPGRAAMKYAKGDPSMSPMGRSGGGKSKKC